MVETIIKLISESNLNVFDRSEIYQALIKHSDWNAEIDENDVAEVLCNCSDGELIDKICNRSLGYSNKIRLKDEFFEDLDEIDDFDDDELLDELKHRDLDEKDIDELNKIVFKNISDKKEFRCEIITTDKTIVVDNYSEFVNTVFELKDDFSCNDIKIKFL